MWASPPDRRMSNCIWPRQVSFPTRSLTWAPACQAVVFGFVFLPIMEVFKCQILTLVFLNFSELLKGLCGSNSLVPRAIGLPY